MHPFSGTAPIGAGRPAIRLLVLRDPPFAWLAVHDAAPAIPRADQAAMFEPFWRAASADPRGPRGWGLGLAVVQNATETHGGIVSVTSEPGLGTTFTVRLPLAGPLPKASSQPSPQSRPDE